MEKFQFAGMTWSEKSNVVAACIGGLLLLLIIWKNVLSGKKRRLPPGPPAWPVLGHLPILGTMPHQSLMKLSQKYGPLMSIRVGSRFQVVVSSPEMAKIFFRTEDHLFASRPYTIIGDVLMYNFKDLVFSPKNDNWRLLRRIVDSEIFSQKRLKNLKNFRDEEILATIERLIGKGRKGSLVVMHPEIFQLSLDIMCRICFSKDFADCKLVTCDSEKEPIDLYSLMHEFFTTSSVFFVGDYIPFLRKLDLGGHEAALLKTRIRFAKFLDPMIEAHRQKRGGEPEDFLDVLLSLQHDRAGDGFPDEQIKALLQDMLLAGTETTGNTTVWALAELMRHPEVVQRVVDELDFVVGRDRLVEESDLENLKYLKAMVKETFRMYPVAPLGVPHEAMEDTQVAGYDISKTTRVLLNVYAIGRDPTLWTNPDIFDPERFVDKPLDVRGKHFELLPFGTGRRVCPGLQMGLARVEMTLAQFLHACVFSLPAGMEVDVEEGVGMTLPKANPLQVLVTPRLQPEVYSRYGIRL